MIDDLRGAATARRVAWNTVAQAAARATTIGLALVSTVLLTRHLGVDGYGDFTAVLVFVALFVAFFDLGTQTLLVRYIAQGVASPVEAVGKALTLRLGLATVVAAVAGAVALLLYADDERVLLGIAVALPSLVFSAIATTLIALFQAQLRMHLVAAAEIVSQLVVVALIVALVAADRSFYEIVGAVVAGSVVNALAAVVFAARERALRPRVDRVFWRRLVVQALPLGMALIVQTVYFRVDALMLSVLTTSEEVGIYGLAYRFFETATPFAAFLTASVFPLLAGAAAASDRPLLARLAQRMFDVLVVGGVFVVGTVSALAPRIVELVASAEFDEAATPLRVVIAGAGLAFVTNALAYVLIALDRQREALWLSAATLAANVALNAVLIPRWGYNAAACVATASELILLGGSLWLARRHAGWLPALSVTWRALAAGAAMFAVAYLLPVPFVVALAAATLTYAGALWVLRVHEAIELRLLLARTS